MGRRLYGWQANDGEEFATKAEMDAHEALAGLADWFKGHLASEEGNGRALAVAARDDGKTLIALLRKVGVKLRNETKPRKRRTKAELADAAD